MTDKGDERKSRTEVVIRTNWTQTLVIWELAW